MDEAEPAPAFRLRAQLLAHKSDVRGVTVSPAGTVATCSRDRLVCVWNVSAPSAPVQSLIGHAHWVTDVVFLDESRVASSCADGSIRIWDASSGKSLVEISAHTQSACSLFADKKYLVSSSWDAFARVHDAATGHLLYTCGPHPAAVWAALALPDGRLVTAAADHSVRLWLASGARSVVLPKAHSDVVRGIATGPRGGFVTVSNDSSLTYWAVDGDGYKPAGGVANLHNGSYIYAVVSDETEGYWRFFTAGEDGAVHVVVATDAADGGVAFRSMQTVMHPSTVWDVAVAPGGDIVTACSDGVARVFTTDVSAVADGDVLRAFDEAVSSRKISTKVLAGNDASKIAKPASELDVPGKKDGEAKVVRNPAGAPEVFMWSASEQKWSKVGDVVDDPASGGAAGDATAGAPDAKYDLVFDVEVGEGGRKQKLGFNRGENPYAAAQRFIDAHELDQDFLDQIAHFITQNAPAHMLGSIAGASRSDPLTGGGRYVPGGGAGGATDGSDPLTGGGRYVPGGGGAAEGTRGNVAARRHVPRRGWTTFLGSRNIEAIVKKISAGNEQACGGEGGTHLDEAEMSVFMEQLVPKLRQLESSDDAMVVVDDDECAVVEKMVQLPTRIVFPALDVARIVIGLPSGQKFFFSKKNGEILDGIMTHAESVEANAAVLIMACKFVCNMFAASAMSSHMREKWAKVVASCGSAAKSPNARVRECYANLLSNLALYMHESKMSLAERMPVIGSILQAAEGEKEEGTVYILMVALGTLMMNDAETQQYGAKVGAAKCVVKAARMSKRLQEVADEIRKLVPA